MKITDIKVDSSIFLDVERGNSYYTFPSKGYDITDEGIIVISPFGMQSEISYLIERDVVYVRQIEGGKMTKWLCDFVQEVKIQEGNGLLLNATSAGEDANRRAAYRLPVSCRAKVLNHIYLKEIYIVDLSLAGLGFFSKVELDLRETLNVELVDDNFKVPLTIRVIRHIPNIIRIYHYGAVIIKSNSTLNKYFLTKQREEIQRQRMVSDQNKR